jgi:hypothetical protein
MALPSAYGATAWVEATHSSYGPTALPPCYRWPARPARNYERRRRLLTTVYTTIDHQPATRRPDPLHICDVVYVLFTRPTSYCSPILNTTPAHTLARSHTTARMRLRGSPRLRHFRRLPAHCDRLQRIPTMFIDAVHCGSPPPTCAAPAMDLPRGRCRRLYSQNTQPAFSIAHVAFDASPHTARSMRRVSASPASSCTPSVFATKPPHRSTRALECILDTARTHTLLQARAYNSCLPSHPLLRPSAPRAIT